MDGAGSGAGSGKRTYTLRKLCSDIEEYESLPVEEMRIDLDLLSKRLNDEGFDDVVVQGPQLTVLMDDIGVVARVYASGAVHLQANLRGDCLRACDIIYALAKEQDSREGETRRENRFE